MDARVLVLLSIPLNIVGGYKTPSPSALPSVSLRSFSSVLKALTFEHLYIKLQVNTILLSNLSSYYILLYRSDSKGDPIRPYYPSPYHSRNGESATYLVGASLTSWWVDTPAVPHLTYQAPSPYNFHTKQVTHRKHIKVHQKDRYLIDFPLIRLAGFSSVKKTKAIIV